MVLAFHPPPLVLYFVNNICMQRPLLSCQCRVCKKADFFLSRTVWTLHNSSSVTSLLQARQLENLQHTCVADNAGRFCRTKNEAHIFSLPGVPSSLWMAVQVSLHDCSCNRFKSQWPCDCLNNPTSWQGHNRSSHKGGFWQDYPRPFSTAVKPSNWETIGLHWVLEHFHHYLLRAGNPPASCYTFKWLFSPFVMPRKEFLVGSSLCPWSWSGVAQVPFSFLPLRRSLYEYKSFKKLAPQPCLQFQAVITR